MTGTVKFFKPSRETEAGLRGNYGFITASDGMDYFFVGKFCVDPVELVGRPGVAVEFRPSFDGMNRRVANNIRLVGEHAPDPSAVRNASQVVASHSYDGRK
jgi:hypothetical protein